MATTEGEAQKARIRIYLEVVLAVAVEIVRRRHPTRWRHAICVLIKVTDTGMPITVIRRGVVVLLVCSSSSPSSSPLNSSHAYRTIPVRQLRTSGQPTVQGGPTAPGGAPVHCRHKAPPPGFTSESPTRSNASHFVQANMPAGRPPDRSASPSKERRSTLCGLN